MGLFSREVFFMGKTGQIHVLLVVRVIERNCEICAIASISCSDEARSLAIPLEGFLHNSVIEAMYPGLW